MVQEPKGVGGYSGLFGVVKGGGGVDKGKDFFSSKFLFIFVLGERVVDFLCTR